MAAPDGVPRIEVSLNNANIHATSSRSPTSPQDNLLSPRSLRSPTSTATVVESGDDRFSFYGSSLIPPPSPTLSTRSSVYSGQSASFVTSKDLRNNDPEREYGHSRRPSFASGTTADGYHDVSSRGHSYPKTLRVETTALSPIGNQNERAISEPDERTAHQLELEQDKNLDPSPFSYKPFQLAHLVNPPRSLEAMGHLGGTHALLTGLGTDGERGLSKEALVVNSGTLLYQAVKDQEKRDRGKAQKAHQRKWKWWKWRKGAGHRGSPRHEKEEEREMRPEGDE